MSIQLKKWQAQCNFTQYKGQKSGHYESYFLRANHPTEKKAFWIRYTIFSPKDHPEKALAELWGIWFDGYTGEHVAVKSEQPLSPNAYSNNNFHIDFKDATLNNRLAEGNIKSAKGEISWSLQYESEASPVFLFPLSSYDTPLPKAKSLVSLPMARFNGTYTVNGESKAISNWVGSQNHNWGEKHTDYYAWGQVAGFDNAPDAFLEVGSGKLKIFGDVFTPFLTPVVLRHEGKEYAFNSWGTIVKAKAELNYYEWHFSSENNAAKITGVLKAHADDFVGLTYYNPPGGNKFCLNTKIASCEIDLMEKSRIGLSYHLKTNHRAAFEILTDDPNHGITLHV
ncbi:MAG: hypothetical protein U0T77_05470 [Chitinophagales bacterium]